MADSSDAAIKRRAQVWAVSGFIHDANGNAADIEKSGLVNIGDILSKVNGESVLDHWLTPVDVIRRLTHMKRPVKLSFRPYGKHLRANSIVGVGSSGKSEVNRLRVPSTVPENPSYTSAEEGHGVHNDSGDSFQHSADEGIDSTCCTSLWIQAVVIVSVVVTTGSSDEPLLHLPTARLLPSESTASDEHIPHPRQRSARAADQKLYRAPTGSETSDEINRTLEAVNAEAKQDIGVVIAGANPPATRKQTAPWSRRRRQGERKQDDDVTTPTAGTRPDNIISPVGDGPLHDGDSGSDSEGESNVSFAWWLRC